MIMMMFFFHVTEFAVTKHVRWMLERYFASLQSERSEQYLHILDHRLFICICRLSTSPSCPSEDPDSPAFLSLQNTFHLLASVSSFL